MKPQPCTSITTPDYPDARQHQLDRRQFLADLAKAAAAFGLGAMAVSSLAGEIQEPEPKATAQDLLEAGIAKQISDLRSRDFRARKAATAKLIALGKGDGKDATADAKARELVIARMTALKDDKDPEVAERARIILAALTPKTGNPPKDGIPLPGVPPPPAQVKGKIRAIE